MRVYEKQKKKNITKLLLTCVCFGLYDFILFFNLLFINNLFFLFLFSLSVIVYWLHWSLILLWSLLSLSSWNCTNVLSAIVYQKFNIFFLNNLLLWFILVNNNLYIIRCCSCDQCRSYPVHELDLLI